MAKIVLDRPQEDKEESFCIATCIAVNDFKCTGMIWSPNCEEKSNYCSLYELVKCLCPCHENDSEPISSEQKKWLRKRMCSPMGIPFK